MMIGKVKANFSITADIHEKCVCLHCGTVFNTPSYHFEGEASTRDVFNFNFKRAGEKLKTCFNRQLAQVNRYDIMMQNRTLINNDCPDCHNGPTMYVDDEIAHIFSALIRCGLHPEYWQYEENGITEGRISLARKTYPRVIADFIKTYFTAEKSAFEIIIHLDEKFTEDTVKAFEDDANRIYSADDSILTSDEIKIKTYIRAFRGIAWAESAQEALIDAERVYRYYNSLANRYTNAIQSSADAFDDELEEEKENG